MKMRWLAFFALVPWLMLSSIAEAGQSKIYMVNGDITEKNYKGFEQFLLNSMDTVIGLKVSFLYSPDGTEGLTVNVQDKQFVAYGPGESEIVATEGYELQHGSYVFDGFAIVKSGGVHQGVISLYLQKVDEAQIRLSNARIVNVRAERLNPKYKKKG